MHRAGSFRKHPLDDSTSHGVGQESGKYGLQFDSTAFFLCINVIIYSGYFPSGILFVSSVAILMIKSMGKLHNISVFLSCDIHTLHNSTINIVLISFHPSRNV